MYMHWQIVLEQGSIDKPMTFTFGLLQLIFHSVFTYAYKGIFNPNIYSNISAKFCRRFVLHLVGASSDDMQEHALIRYTHTHEFYNLW